jgi:hypothetical protein
VTRKLTATERPPNMSPMGMKDVFATGTRPGDGVLNDDALKTRATHR